MEQEKQNCHIADKKFAIFKDENWSGSPLEQGSIIEFFKENEHGMFAFYGKDRFSQLRILVYLREDQFTFIDEENVDEACEKVVQKLTDDIVTGTEQAYLVTGDSINDAEAYVHTVKVKLEEPPEDNVNPTHYKENLFGVELYKVMIDTFGVDEYRSFCKLNAFKYRMRAGNKNWETAGEDIEKAMWYESKIKQLS